jgi:hypothetical protein
VGVVALHFLIGSLGALLLLLLFARLSGTRGDSAVFGVVLIGLSCAVLAHFLSPWATPVVLLLYAMASVHEWRQGRGRDTGRD